MKTRLFDARRLDSARGQVRVAIVVPKNGRTAVRRNQLKRRVRELARMHLLPAPASCDVLLRARPEAYDMEFEGLKRDVAVLAERL